VYVRTCVRACVRVLCVPAVWWVRNEGENESDGEGEGQHTIAVECTAACSSSDISVISSSTSALASFNRLRIGASDVACLMNGCAARSFALGLSSESFCCASQH